MYVEDVEDRSNTPKGCNAMYVKDVEDRSNTPKGCNAMYVEDVEDYLRHALIYTVFDGMVGKPSVSAFQNFFRIENPLSIKEVMSQNVCVCSFPIFDIFDIHSITPLMCTLSIFDIFDIALIFCTVFNAFNAMYLNTSNIKQCALTHIDTHPLMYTQQIR